MSQREEDAGPTVLLVEDSLDDVLLTRRAFRRAGIERVLRVCSDGDEAMEYLLTQAQSSLGTTSTLPALILLDWKLPKKDGLEVLIWIRSQPQLQAAPVVVVSASGQQDEIDRARAAGADEYLHKPLHARSLLDLLDSLNLASLKALVVSTAG